ncbi:MAG: pectin methylesterase [Lachnospiraceae bacterium]|nr:pectin methylesterase [Lachnospiraceae bacterium]
MRTFTVDAEGNGDFKTLNEAAEALKGGSEKTLLMIRPGEYFESVVFECSNLTIEGDTQEVVYISDSNYARMKDPDGNEWGTFKTAVLRTDGDNIIIRNLTIENKAGFGFKIGQAVALYSDGNGFLCENCKIIARQDTLFTAPLPETNKHGKNEGFGPKGDLPRTPTRQYFKDCYIEGDIDFIFGGASVLFENCTIFSHDSVAEHRMKEMIDSVDNDWDGNKSNALRGYVCAPSTDEKLEFGYLFLYCHFMSNCPAGTVYLARPWRPYGKAYFINCVMDQHIKKELFSDWDNAANRKTCSFVVAGCRRADGSRIDSGGENSFGKFIDENEAAVYIRRFREFIADSSSDLL